jgi:L-alanine-DL-glutamate epimerase-like enolase superfamily enzyme
MKTKAGIFDLELKHTFGIARSSHKIQKTFIVALSQDGHTGYGEATENAYYRVTADKLMSAWEDIRPVLENYTLKHPAGLWEILKSRTGNFRFLMAAIDEAAWDLYGKINGFGIIDYWKLNRNKIPVSTFTIGLDDIEIMKQKILEQPWPVYKIKLGTGYDEEIIRELRQVTRAPFRVDANAAWSYDKARRIIPVLKDLGVELVEQPLPADAYKDTGRLKQISPLPLIADESCQTEDDLEKAFLAFHGINVKLTKAGGMTPAKHMYETAAKTRAIKMIGCMTESSVGISAAAQFLPMVNYADVDGALLLKNDIAEGVKITPGGAIYPEVKGNGVVLKISL